MQRRYNGSAWVVPTFNRRWNGSAWQDCEFVRRWKGLAWIDVWTGRYFALGGIAGTATKSTIANGIWTAHAEGNIEYPGAWLLLTPARFPTPLTLEIDWEYSRRGDSAAYIGSFNSSLRLVSGQTFGTHSRRTDIVSVAENSNAINLGILFNINPEHGGVSADVTVYGIKIDGESIPIK